MSILNLTPSQLRQAADLQERIAKLQSELIALSGGVIESAPATTKPAANKKRGMSAAGKARIVAAQKLRWAKIKAAKAKTVSKPAAKPAPAAKPSAKAVIKRNISPESRAKMAAAAKAMWAAKKAAKK